jgi:hypothetical protein
VEVCATLRVPEEAIFLAVVALMGGASTSSVRVRLIAESTIVTELGRAVLPADRSYTIVAVAAQRITKQTILFFPFRARRNGDTNATTVGLDPATFDIRVELLLA